VPSFNLFVKKRLKIPQG